MNRTLLIFVLSGLISKGKFPAACGEVVIFVSVKKSIHT
jgi:hypothetical protein